MDHFGIGAAMSAMFATYATSPRRTGRTTSLVESVKDGDRIVFADEREARRVQRLCQERGVCVECITVDTRDPHRLMERGTSQGRTLFDHHFVEEVYRIGINRIATMIDELERATSGEGPAHRETRRRAIELSRWGRPFDVFNDVGY